MRVAIVAALLLPFVVPAAEPRRPAGEAGKFDYYMLALSWSPAYCAGRPDNARDPQCAPGRRFSFVLHGLWPQYARPVRGAGWPQFCSDLPGLNDPRQMLDIMPSPSLVRHEWEKHGTCSGLDAQGYFNLARRAFQSVKVPARFAAPAEYVTVSPAEVQRAFIDANSGLGASSVVVTCSSNYLSEVRVCMDRNLKPVPCVGQRECRVSSVRMPPVR